MERGTDGSSGAPARSWMGIRDELDPDHCWAALGCAHPDHAVLLPQHQLACGIGAAQPTWCAATGALRTVCTGCWTTPSRRTAAACTPAMPRATTVSLSFSLCRLQVGIKSSLWFPHWTQPARPWAIVPHYRIPACFRCAIISWLARSQSVVRACSLATMPTGSTPPNFTNTRDTPRI